jgi:Uma2 family endonuclease
MSTVPGTRMTRQEYLALPEEPPYLEYRNGEVVAKAMPGPDHSALVTNLLTYLRTFTRERDDVWVDTELRHYNEAEDRYFLPDVLVTRRSRRPDRWIRPVLVMPDIAVEVVSPDDSLGDVLEKTGFHLRNGVEVVWIVDQESEQVSVFRRGEHPLTLSEGDVLTGGSRPRRIRAAPVGAVHGAARGARVAQRTSSRSRFAFTTSHSLSRIE